MARSTFTSDFLRRMRQREATTGRPLTPAEIRGLLQAELEAEFRTQEERRRTGIMQERTDILAQGQRLAEQQFGESKRQFDIEAGIKQDAIDRQISADRITGLTQLAGAPKLLSEGIGGFKDLFGIGAEKGVEKGAQEAIKAGTSTPASTTTAQSQLLSGASGGFQLEGGASTLAGAGFGGEQLVGGATQLGPLGGEQLVGGATTLGGETAAGAGFGLSSGLAAGGAGALGGFVGSKIGETKLFDEITPFGGEQTNRLAGGALGGAAAGFFATGFNPIGALIGGVVGLVTGGKGGGK
jgi:hypothetical protein